MYISDLQLHGFKSFAHKTHVKFDSGITAIVGPNGCGKSNIVDALRWVLGEQRPTLLRSSAMSNVIFNGTAKKKALGMADVSLTFVNDKGILPVEYSELTITRRLYRSGDSEYLINNTPCRLKDIMDLFMDTGMSSDAYSVIELKMVEEILNDRNNDRRRLFEEAAGVTRYKEKRRQTIRKLDDTLKDLQRLEDILIEVRKKTRSLELQAEKAGKAKKYKTELEHLDKAYTLHELSTIREELEPLQTRISNAEKEKKEIGSRVEELEESEEKARTLLIEKERHQAEAQRRVSQLHSSIREMETNLKITREKIVNEEGVIRQHQSDIEQGGKDLAELEQLREQSISKLENFSDERERSALSLKESKEKFADVQQQFTKVRHELYELEIEISDLSRKLSGLQSDRIKIESRLENTEDDQLRIDGDIRDLKDEIENAKGELSLTREKLDSIDSELKSEEKRLEESSRIRQNLEEKRETLRDEIRSLKSRKDAVESEISLLGNLAESGAGLPSSISFLQKEHGDQFALLSTVGDLLNTKEELASALETALGESIHFVIVKNMGDALKASRILKENGKGKATFIPLSELKKSYSVHEKSIARHVGSDSSYAPVVQLLLGSTLLVDDLENAVSILEKDEATSAVTRDGDLLTASRFLKSGSNHKQAGIRLALKDKVEKLNTESNRYEKSITQRENELQKLNEEIDSHNLDSIRASIRQIQQRSREAEQQSSRYQSSIQVYEKNIQELNSRKVRLLSNQDTAREELDTLHPRQKELQQKITELSGLQEEKKEILRKLEEERAIAQNRYNDAQLKHQDVKNKADNLEKDLERAENGISSMKTRLASRKELQSESRNKIETFKEVIEQTEKQLEGSRSQKSEADQKLAEAEEASSRQRGAINEIEKELKELRRRKEVNLELVHHLSMAREKFELQAQSHSDHIWETYGILMDQVTEQLPDETTPEEAKARIGWLRQKLNKIGDVNPLAIDEFREEKERLSFYEEQIDDLQKAEAEMRETIDEINSTATERFNETFEKIRNNFKTVFNTLFHEDDFCDLMIRDEGEDQDPLEAKIDIRANPKGKRPSSINQLSGGEKTLTAIALLFAIYLVKPSPFCVLDEVDAPLDDANIERFAAMIRKFSEDTQFIIITHNKKTMSKAEMMYGVTMPETGVSRLVGVKLDEVAEA
ncbi:chromosome segregation protein SMC [Rhodohalobacter mucosus]|uniref:Chromosome partition protein Smc n=1 Tax=Rhodohalobacter mucosus TaxID=2079485 RepID=A0A316TUW8_9BACT|nr:chromosome segregation protein SMC [Rhodohalobacter mucosus]PWN06152.1 chromosome segregation protein SMC [Rhodohalobacter mucosus]